MTQIHFPYPTPKPDPKSSIMQWWRIRLHNRRIYIGAKEDGGYAIEFHRLTGPREIQVLQFGLGAEAFQALILGGMQILAEQEKEPV